MIGRYPNWSPRYHAGNIPGFGPLPWSDGATAPGSAPIEARMIGGGFAFPGGGPPAAAADPNAGGLGGLLGSLTKQDKLFMLAQALSQIGAGVSSSSPEQGGLVGGFSRGVAAAIPGALNTASGLKDLRMQSAQRALLMRRRQETNDPREQYQLDLMLAGVDPAAAARLTPRPRTRTITSGVPGHPDQKRQEIVEDLAGTVGDPYLSRQGRSGTPTMNQERLDEQARGQWASFVRMAPDQRSTFLATATPSQREALTRMWYGEAPDAYQQRLDSALAMGVQTGIPTQPVPPEGPEEPGLLSHIWSTVSGAVSGPSVAAELPASSPPAAAPPAAPTPPLPAPSEEDVEADLRKRLGTPIQPAAPQTKADPYAGMTFFERPPQPGPNEERKFIAGRGWVLVPKGWKPNSGVPQGTPAQGQINLLDFFKRGLFPGPSSDSP